AVRVLMCPFFVSSHDAPPDRPSFPTRRSSDLDGFVADVCALDGRVAADVQATLLNEHVRLLDRASRWFVHQSPEHLDVLATIDRSEEHTSELQSRFDIVCRLMLELKKYLR